jgi:hypothetical protein
MNKTLWSRLSVESRRPGSHSRSRLFAGYFETFHEDLLQSQGFIVARVKSRNRALERPNPDQWRDDELMMLEEASAVFVDGLFSAATLRNEYYAKRLRAWNKAGRIVTTPTAMKEWMACPQQDSVPVVPPKALTLSSANLEPLRASASTISGMASVKSVPVADLTKLMRLKRR